MKSKITRCTSNPFYLLLPTIALNFIITSIYLRNSDGIGPAPAYTSTDLEDRLDSLKGSLLYTTRITAKKLYEQQCALLDLKKQSKKLNTHSTGGFCLTLDDKDKIAANYPLDGKLADALVNNVYKSMQNATLTDIGAGPGHYGARWLKEGAIKGYRALDAASGADILSNGLVEWTDFTEELQHYWKIRKSTNIDRDEAFYREYFWISQHTKPRSDIELTTSDWVLSFEVLEHIPPHKEKTVVNNLLSLTENGIILSWAVPLQNGLGHINEKSNEYVLNLFVDQLGLNYCQQISTRLRNGSSQPWFKNTIFVFAKKPLYNGFSCE